MSNNVFNNHPLIQNSNQYFLEKKYVSINSEDRNISKYPHAGEFEIALPQELLNIASCRLYSWSFPANYNVFSILNNNVKISFKFTTLYNPGEIGIVDPLLEGIFAALYNYGDKEVIVDIETGFYTPDQIVVELTNKFNNAATRIIYEFLNDPANLPTYQTAKDLFVSYDRFNIVYNCVGQKIWFGNTADKFTLTNESTLITTQSTQDINHCLRSQKLPEWSNWGLPSFLGFTRCNAVSYSVDEYIKQYPIEASQNTALYQGNVFPRFSYESDNDGYWLLPTLEGANVYFLQAPFKINVMGPAYIYMDIEGMNCIDETAPWNLSEYTTTHTKTNGITNSSFAKIPVPTTPLSQWFDNDMGPYKFWNPPAERMAKLKIKIRYHNGMLVNFGHFPYSFMLEFNLLKPQQERIYSVVNAYDLNQQKSIYT